MTVTVIVTRDHDSEYYCGFYRFREAQDRTIAAHDDLLLEDSVQRLRGVYC